MNSLTSLNVGRLIVGALLEESNGFVEKVQPMLRKRNSTALAKACVLMLITGFLAKTGIDQNRVNSVEARPKRVPSLNAGMVETEDPLGDYGGDLAFLREYHEGPRARGESNHYFDLWDETSTLPVLARVNGLTNNHALIIDSHGKAGLSRHGSGYGLYPGERLVPPGSQTPYFSPRDFAAVLGPQIAASIHNIVIAGCNLEGRLRSAEFREAFPNATNVTYMTPGELAFKPMFYQAIVEPSAEVRTLYGRPLPQSTPGRYECRVQRAPTLDAHPLGVYIADLYLPGAPKPYRTVRAGRELLAPAGLNRPKPPPFRTAQRTEFGGYQPN